ncbi:MAG TPA: HAMP domain-containing protein, partial [Jatrophihabitans sp.]|nr:HAMP domain-containing protein [Jatrophihabitans sp.]
MTGRILASFVVVLVVVLVAIVVPLGFIVTGQQHRDFVDAARAAARSLAAVAEEQLDDHASTRALSAVLTSESGRGDRVAVLGRTGAVVAATAPQPAAAVVTAARNGWPIPQPAGRVAVTAHVGGADRAVGTVVLVRDAATVRQRARDLWLVLAGAALAALIVGVAAGWLLGRWIGRPLRSLVTAAHRIGAGHPDARADPTAGPAQVREVASAFNDMADRVRALVRTQQAMTAEVSHQ